MKPKASFCLKVHLQNTLRFYQFKAVKNFLIYDKFRTKDLVFDRIFGKAPSNVVARFIHVLK